MELLMKACDMNGAHVRPARGHAAAGQSLTELALITPVIALMLLGVIFVSSAYGARMDLQAATAQAARIGAIQGNVGHTSILCPYGASNDAVDDNIVKTVLATHGLIASNIQRIDIYKADLNGQISGNLINSYLPPFTFPLTAASYGWSSCIRQDAEPSDSLGVHVVYTYHPIVPLFGQDTLTMNDHDVQRLNPSKSVKPCPIADPPDDLVAHWNMAQLEPTATDILTWTAVPAATSYLVYANVNGTGLGSTPVLTVPNPPASGPVVASYTGNTTYAPTSYAVRGYNSLCGPGDLGNTAINYQPALPLAPAVVTATASTTSLGNDDVSWAPVTDALTYTIVMTPSAGAGPIQTKTTVAPVTSISINDFYTTPVTVTYAVSVTNPANVPGPSAVAVVTPTVVDNTAATFTYRYISSPTPGGHWTQCANANATTSGCSGNPGVTSDLYSNSYNGSLAWSNTISDTIDVPVVLSAPAHVQLYGATTPKGGQAWVWVDSTSHPTAVPGTATLFDWYSSAAVARKLITTQPIGPNQYLHITLNGKHAGCTAAGGSGCASYVGIDAINVQP